MSSHATIMRPVRGMGAMSGKRTKALRREFRAEHGRAPVTRLRNNGTCVVPGLQAEARG